MRKRIVSVLSTALATVVLLCACGRATTPPPAPSSSSTASVSSVETPPVEVTSEPVELRFSWWGSENRHEAFQQVIDLYTAKNPHVTIKAEFGAWDGWQQNILTQMGGNTEADIVQVNYNWVHSFGRGKNVFVDLRTLSDYIDLSNWDDEYLAAMTVGGELGAVPHGMNGRAHLYNKPLYEETNLAYPTTYEELIAAGKTIGKANTPTGADNKYALLLIDPANPDLYIAQMLFNETGKIMQVDGKVQYSEEEVAKVFKEYLSFAEAAAMPTFQQQDPLDNESNPVWTSGRGGGIYEWVNAMDKYLGSYKGGDARDEIVVGPYIVPNAGEKPTIYVKPNLGYAISKNSKNKEVAADFLNFFFTDEEAVKILGTSIGISSNKVTRAFQEQAGVLSGIMKEGYEMLDSQPQVVMDPYFEDSNVRGARYTAIEAFRSGASSVEAAAKEYIERQQAELDKLLK